MAERGGGELMRGSLDCVGQGRRRAFDCLPVHSLPPPPTPLLPPTPPRGRQALSAAHAVLEAAKLEVTIVSDTFQQQRQQLSQPSPG